MEEKLLDWLSFSTRCFCLLLKSVQKCIIEHIPFIFFVLVSGILMAIFYQSAFNSDSMQVIAEWGAFIVAIFGCIYAIIQYQNHLDEEKRKLLCEYNQRYSCDKNIEEVIKWMLLIAKTNEKTGEIIGVQTELKNMSPGIH